MRIYWNASLSMNEFIVDTTIRRQSTEETHP